METGEERRTDHASEIDEAERLRRELDAERQRMLRLRADFENVRRRMAGEHDAARRDGCRRALLPVLPVLDTLERALAAGSSDPAFYRGVAATHELFVAALREAGAEPVESVGRPFDPTVHEATMTVPADGVEPGVVVREEQRGWRLGNDLLRPARVVVSAAREGDESWQ